MSKSINDTLVCGFGQCGGTVARTFATQFNYESANILTMNSAQDSIADEKSVLLKSPLGTYEGSARNPMITLDTIIPHNEDLIRKSVLQKISGDIRQVVMFCSLGGGTGSMLTRWVAKEVIIPHNEEREQKLNVIVVPCFAFKFEGNPCNSNSIAMLRMFNELSHKICVLPVFNDLVHLGGGKTMFDRTNEYISQKVQSTINFEAFAGAKKSLGGLSSLDKNEFNRVLNPVGGFLSRVSVNLQTIENMPTGDKFLEHFDPRLNKFDIRTAKSLAIVFRTVKGKQIGTEMLKAIHEVFPNQLKIFAEAEAWEPPMSVEILANGIDIPNDFLENYSTAIASVDKLKEMKKEAKKENKETLKAATKKLFKM